MKKIFFAGCALLLCMGFARVQAQEKDALSEQQLKMMEAFHIVSAADIDQWARTLVSDEYRGRRSGDIGYDMAVDFVIDHFMEWGIQPKGDNGTYENTFAQPYCDVQGVGFLKAYYAIGKDTVVKNYVARKDYFPTALSDGGEATGELVYVGYGINAPELGYNDYKGVDLTGKIVLCEGGFPYKGKNVDSLKMWNKYLRAQPKIAAAKAAGAKGLLFVSKYANPMPMQTPGMIVAFVSKETAQELLSGTGRSFDEWHKRFDAFKGKAVPTGHIVSLGAENTFYGDRTTANIVGVIEGSDPVLKNEYIILGAHIDHLGMLPEIYPGAQDNVSGSVITMAAAKALALSKVDLKRSVVIVLFASEELGILGAEHFLKTLPFPKEKVTCMINTDMLATGTGFMVHSSNEWADLVPYFRSASEEWARRPFKANLTPWEYKTRLFTDGNLFQNFQIPTFELKSTGGKWPAPYHVPEDTMDQLDPVIMADAARPMAIAVIQIANK